MKLPNLKVLWLNDNQISEDEESLFNIIEDEFPNI